MKQIRNDIYNEINAERDRQDDKFGWIGTTSTMSGDDEFKKLGVLGEEYGEVSRELLETEFAGVHGTTPHLEEELIQCAAVCVAWIEAIREKRVPKHHFVVAATYGHAAEVVRSLHLPANDWTWVDSSSTLDRCRLDDGTAIVLYETWVQRKNYCALEVAVHRAEARGCRVIRMSEADLA